MLIKMAKHLVGFAVLMGVALPISFAQQPPMTERDKAITKKYREEAWAHFQRRCKSDARETINRVVENVDGIFLMKPRERATQAELGDQYWMGDPYGYSSYEALNAPGAYLYGRSGRTITGAQFTPIVGYQFVETPYLAAREGSNSPTFLRYKLEEVEVLNTVTRKPERRIEPRATKVVELRSRYGVTWEDISTPEDRKYWVAGGRLAVVDLRTNEALGERVGYVIEPKFGDQYQGRRPWSAVAMNPAAFCPQFELRSHRNTEFVAKVVKAIPKASNAK